MSQHPLDDCTYSTPQGSVDSLPPLTDDDLSGFVRKLSSAYPKDDKIIRAASPHGRRYLKPINGIQTKGFARSALRRSSVLTLGSIERLQNFYAKRELKVNKGGTLGFQKTLTEEPDDFDEQLPTPKAPPPSWIDLDVETDLDVLLNICFGDIQHTLTTWSMVVGPRQSSSSSTSSHPLSSDSADDSSRAATPTEGNFQILPLIQSVTKMLDSVRNYTVHRHDLSDSALAKLRQASLALLEAMKDLENQYREEGNDEEGYLYKASEFNLLERERQAIHNYLRAVETYAFNPPHHIGSPPAVFTPEIQALMGRTSILSLSDDELNENNTKKVANSIPVWLERGSFPNDSLGRYHALLVDNQATSDSNEEISIPDPKEDEDAFLGCLADGKALCIAYNNIVKRSKRPFGFINKIHSDTRRTYRAVENLRFFTAACKFRFELTFDEFDPSEIARKTDKGLVMIKNIVAAFCDCVICELREQVDMIQKQK
ncbi:hypothetical protein BCV72DRAFT_315755 [Rhizopus microsporus var. microsporus]|uniref:Calponin-homology (CH) domain-containing protein n=2 Tax=Rhizopus microsporus TaxID=58291 RepID=A0A2G4T4P2_RHIZD|nr:uncharacterized protein RHIMIDRAFT_246574 [Rhizopus microsporus ATCC 52813]ORE10155.1 hypothetical protein BCV72DRAFT_315755 [Rhizopus microsporus var. microsporus]PHZ15969.1 hypothetical protein RHIMIDRAFT_246574 [Rhizopus microsporus ATCC 52813]